MDSMRALIVRDPNAAPKKEEVKANDYRKRNASVALEQLRECKELGLTLEEYQALVVN
ncbi:hypothetical protein [Vibrio sp. R78045]|uniref:hypothetical protein n=1 Tax=Vibrio sp. R78045 TaxID=3093868 RepID=UPI0036F235ED